MLLGCSACLTVWVRRWIKTNQTELKCSRGDPCWFFNQQNQVSVRGSKKDKLIVGSENYCYVLTQQVTILVLESHIPLKTCQPTGKGNIRYYIHIMILFKWQLSKMQCANSQKSVSTAL